MNLAEPDIKLNFMNLTLVVWLSHEEKFNVWSRPKLSLFYHLETIAIFLRNTGRIGKDDSPWILETNQMRKPF